MKIFFYTAVLILIPLLIFSQNQNTKDYIEKYKLIAIKEMKRTNIPASITLAQAILESSSGESDLASKFNNHFGIKCKNDWKGKTTYKNDDKKNECFRVYPSADSSFIDHSNFLKFRPNYAPLFELDPVDDTAWAYGLKKAGYATERDYPLRLLKIIDDYELAQYNYPELDDDSIVSNEPVKVSVKDTIPAISPKDTSKVVTPIDSFSLNQIKGIVDDTTVSLSPIAPMKGIADLKPDTIINKPILNKIIKDTSHIILHKDTATSVFKQDAITKKVNPYPLNQKFKINQVPAIWAEKGRSFLEIANTYHVSLYKIYKFNKLAETDLVEQDQLIYLGEPKKDTATIDPIKNTPKPSLKSILKIPFLKKKNK